MRPVVWLDQVGKQDVGLVGGKGANLGELVKADIPVPPAFIVTSEAFFHFLRQANLRPKLRRLLRDLDVNDSDRLWQVATRIQELIRSAPMPEEIAQAIREAYRALGGGPVAVRSSATAEDLPEASFAGQQCTFLNVEGEEAVLEAVRGCWASLFEARAIFYRVQQGFDHLKVGIAVPVQRMVQSDRSGVMFTVEPVKGDAGKILVEAVYGLGEAIVSGAITPDTYLVDKATLRVLDRRVVRQVKKLARNPSPAPGEEPNVWVDVPLDDQDQQKLTDAEVRHLAALGRRIEEHYGHPQDIEWAEEGGQFYIVQTRPVTTLRGDAFAEEEEGPEETAPVLLEGAPGSPGVAVGTVRVALEPREAIAKVREGDILVTVMTAPDWVPAMKRAAAIVTERGGRTCHAAIVSRELGIPLVMGVEGATERLRDGDRKSVV